MSQFISERDGRIKMLLNQDFVQHRSELQCKKLCVVRPPERGRRACSFRGAVTGAITDKRQTEQQVAAKEAFEDGFQIKKDSKMLFFLLSVAM